MGLTTRSGTQTVGPVTEPVPVGHTGLTREGSTHASRSTLVELPRTPLTSRPLQPTSPGRPVVTSRDELVCGHVGAEVRSDQEWVVHIPPIGVVICRKDQDWGLRTGEKTRKLGKKTTLTFNSQ